MKSKLNLLFVTPTFNSGGAERVVVRIANAMAGFGHDVTLCVLNGIGPLSSEVSVDVNVHDLNIKRARYAWIKLIRKCNEIRPDLMFSSVNRINSVLLLFKMALGGTKLVVREPNTPSVSIMHLPFESFYRLAYKYLYKRADRIVAQSQFMLRDLVDNFCVPDNLITHIYNPVDIDSVGEKNRTRKVGDKRSRCLNAVVCGRLDKQKGIDILLEALAQTDLRKRIKITIIGEGVLKGALISLADHLDIADAVEFIGYKESPKEYFKYADFTISSSRWEGLPNVVLESMAVGTPVLATNCPGGTAEIIQENINGILVKNEDVDALKNGLETMGNDYANYDAEAIKKSIAKFSSELIMDKYNALFQNLCNKM